MKGNATATQVNHLEIYSFIWILFCRTTDRLFINSYPPDIQRESEDEFPVQW